MPAWELLRPETTLIISIFVPTDESALMPSPLSVTMQQQEQCNWCWAAVAASLSSATPPKPGAPEMSQCQIASQVRNLDCCNDGHVFGGCPDSKCNQFAPVQLALTAIARFGGSSSEVPDQDTVTQQIGRSCPIVGEIRWNDSQPHNHFIMIVDYDTNGSGQFVVMIADPGYKTGITPSTYSLDELIAGRYGTSGNGAWIQSYFTTY